MRWIIRAILTSAIMVVCACGTSEQSSSRPDPPASGKSAAKNATIPDIVTLAASQGEVKLPHRAHAKRLHCAMCHSEIEPGQLAWDEVTAHAYCRDCHTTSGGGPTTCTGCHKK